MALWAKMSCWCSRSEETGRTGLKKLTACHDAKLKSSQSGFWSTASVREPLGCSGTCGITDVQLTYLQQLHSGNVSRRTKIFKECFQLLCELLRWRIKTVLESPRSPQGAPDKVAPCEQWHSTVIGNTQTKGKKVVYVILCVKCLKLSGLYSTQSRSTKGVDGSRTTSMICLRVTPNLTEMLSESLATGLTMEL